MVFICRRGRFSCVPRSHASRDVMFARVTALSKLILGQAQLVFISEEALAARLVPKDDFMGAHTTLDAGAGA